jgi:hypothetical protein
MLVVLLVLIEGPSLDEVFSYVDQQEWFVKLVVLGVIITIGVVIYRELTKHRVRKQVYPRPHRRHTQALTRQKEPPEDKMPRRMACYLIKERLIIIELPHAFATVTQSHALLHVERADAEELAKIVGDDLGAALLKAIARKKILGLAQIGHDYTRLFLLGNSLAEEGDMFLKSIEALRSVLWPGMDQFTDIDLRGPEDITTHAQSKTGNLANLLESGLTPDIMRQLGENVVRLLPPTAPALPPAA